MDVNTISAASVDGAYIMLNVCLLHGHLLCAFVCESGSFTILEDASMPFLFGLDMLKRHQCSIDLKRGVMVLGTHNVTVPFLSESVRLMTKRHLLFQRSSHVVAACLAVRCCTSMHCGAFEVVYRHIDVLHCTFC